MFGQFFGRPLDTIHQPVSFAQGAAGELQIRFDGGELLTIWEPVEVRLSPAEFRVERAQRVRWQWSSYGEPPTAQSRRFREYWIHGTEVCVEETDTRGMLQSPRQLRAEPCQPAVELL